MSRPYEPNPADSKFPKAPGTTIKNTKTEADIIAAAKAAALKYQTDNGWPGAADQDPRFDLEMMFSGDGKSYGNPLVSPSPGIDYFIRVRLTQHQQDPLLQGFAIRWTAPAGWYWVDGLGDLTFDEATSNPLIVTRVIVSQSPVVMGAFRAVVEAKYPLMPGVPGPESHYPTQRLARWVNVKLYKAGTTVGNPGTVNYTVVSGNNLHTIAAHFYGSSSGWLQIYQRNRDVIESTARAHGYASSDNGHWIFPGEVLVIPGVGTSTPGESIYVQAFAAANGAGPVSDWVGWNLHWWHIDSGTYAGYLIMPGDPGLTLL